MHIWSILSSPCRYWGAKQAWRDRTDMLSLSGGFLVSGTAVSICPDSGVTTAGIFSRIQYIGARQQDLHPRLQPQEPFRCMLPVSPVPRSGLPLHDEQSWEVSWSCVLAHQKHVLHSKSCLYPHDLETIHYYKKEHCRPNYCRFVSALFCSLGSLAPLTWWHCLTFLPLLNNSFLSCPTSVPVHLSVHYTYSAGTSKCLNADWWILKIELLSKCIRRHMLSHCRP